MTRLEWRLWHPGRYVAVCGPTGVGRAVVETAPGFAWRWRLDMLPGDAEPIITGSAASAAGAMRDVERQVAQWPALIEGATR